MSPVRMRDLLGLLSRRPASSAPSVAGPVARTPEWRSVPAVQRLLTVPSLVTDPGRFRDGLATWGNPSLVGVAAHLRSPDAPAGSVTGLVLPARRPAVPDLRSGAPENEGPTDVGGTDAGMSTPAVQRTADPGGATSWDAPALPESPVPAAPAHSAAVPPRPLLTVPVVAAPPSPASGSLLSAGSAPVPAPVHRPAVQLQAVDSLAGSPLHPAAPPRPAGTPLPGPVSASASSPREDADLTLQVLDQPPADDLPPQQAPALPEPPVGGTEQTEVAVPVQLARTVGADPPAPPHPLPGAAAPSPQASPPGSPGASVAASVAAGTPRPDAAPETPVQRTASPAVGTAAPRRSLGLGAPLRDPYVQRASADLPIGEMPSSAGVTQPQAAAPTVGVGEPLVPVRVAPAAQPDMPASGRPVAAGRDPATGPGLAVQRLVLPGDAPSSSPVPPMSPPPMPLPPTSLPPASLPPSPHAAAPSEWTAGIAPTGTRSDGPPPPPSPDVPPTDLPPAVQPPAQLQRAELPPADLPSVEVPVPAPVDDAIETPLVGSPFPPLISGPEPVSAADGGPGAAGSSPPGTVQRSTSLPGAPPDRPNPPPAEERPPSGAPAQATFSGGPRVASIPDLPTRGTPVGPIGLRPLQRVADTAGSPPPAGPPGSTPGSTAVPVPATTVDAGAGWPQGAPAMRSAGRPVQRTTDGRAHGTPSVRGPSPAVQALFGAPQLPQLPALSMTPPDPVAAMGESPIEAVSGGALEQLPAVPELPTALPPVVPGLPGVPAAPAAGTAPPPGGAPAGGALPGGAPADLDALVRRLYDPLARRLKAELRLDRERVGRALDLRH